MADLAAVGSAEDVRKQLQRYLDAGATEVSISPLDRSSSAASSALLEVAASI